MHVAERIFTKLGAGRPVIANFPVNLDKIKRCRGDFLEVDNDQLTPALLMDFSDEYFRKHRFREDRILLVIDEAQLLFNAREWQAEGRKEWTAFFTQHRKYGYEIILVAQFDRMLDRQLRSLIEYEFIHRKVSNFGIYGKILSFWTLGKLFIAVKVWYPLKEKVGAEWFVCRKKYYSLYDSYARFGSDHQTVRPDLITESYEIGERSGSDEQQSPAHSSELESQPASCVASSPDEQLTSSLKTKLPDLCHAQPSDGSSAVKSNLGFTVIKILKGVFRNLMKVWTGK